MPRQPVLALRPVLRLDLRLDLRLALHLALRLALRLTLCLALHLALHLVQVLQTLPLPTQILVLKVLAQNLLLPLPHLQIPLRPI